MYAAQGMFDRLATCSPQVDEDTLILVRNHRCPTSDLMQKYSRELKSDSVNFGVTRASMAAQPSRRRAGSAGWHIGCRN